MRFRYSLTDLDNRVIELSQTRKTETLAVLQSVPSHIQSVLQYTLTRFSFTF